MIWSLFPVTSSAGDSLILLCPLTAGRLADAFGQRRPPKAPNISSIMRTYHRPVPLPGARYLSATEFEELKKERQGEQFWTASVPYGLYHTYLPAEDGSLPGSPCSASISPPPSEKGQFLITMSTEGNVGEFYAKIWPASAWSLAAQVSQNEAEFNIAFQGLMRSGPLDAHNLIYDYLEEAPISSPLRHTFPNGFPPNVIANILETGGSDIRTLVITNIEDLQEARLPTVAKRPESDTVDNDQAPPAHQATDPGVRGRSRC